jgi:hypothetical protein
MKSLSDKEYTCTQDVPVQAEPVEQTMFLYPLPREVALITLGFLRSNDLKSVALVNRAGRNLASLVRIQRFQQRLTDTAIWRCLPTIANDSPGESDKSFITYLRTGLGPRLPVSEAWAANNGTLSAFLSNWVIRFPHTVERLGFGITCYADIQAKVQSLMQLVCSNEKEGRFRACTHLSECMDLADESLKITAWQKYDELDQIFSCLVLFIAISRMPTTNNSVWLIMMSPLNRGLTGAGLMVLESCFPDIFPGLVREAIRIHGLEQRSAEDNHRISAIESILSRLTEENIMSYIDSEHLPPLFPYHLTVQRQIFIEALQAKYSFLIAKMSVKVLLRLEYMKDRFREYYSLLIVPHVLKSSFILNRLNEEGLLAILKEIEKLDFPKVIENHPCLHPFISVNVITDLVNSTKLPGAMIVVFLTQPEILWKLDHDQIVFLAKHLVYTEFDKVLESRAFQDKLAQDPQRNDLIMKLAKDESSLAQRLAKNRYTASLLTTEEINWLIINKIGTHDAFAANDVVLNKLSSVQLLAFIKNTSDVEWLIADNQLHRFTNGDLILLIKYTKCGIKIPTFLEFTTQLLEALPNELIRRAASGGPDGQKMTSNHWFSLACVHTTLGLFIANHYLDQLWENHLVDLRTFYYAKKVNLLAEPDYTRSQVASSVECVSNYQHIIILANTAYLSKLLTVHCQPVDDYPTSRSSVPYRPSPPITESDTQAKTGKKDAGTQWYNLLIQILLLFVFIVAIALVCTGIGSAIGLMGASVVTDFLFASLPFSSSLASCLVGLFVYGVITSFWLVFDTDNDVAPDNLSSPVRDIEEDKFTLDQLIDTTISKEKQDELRYQAHPVHGRTEKDDYVDGVKPSLF